MSRVRNSPDNVSCNQGDEQVNIFGGLSRNNIVINSQALRVSNQFNIPLPGYRLVHMYVSIMMLKNVELYITL